MKQEFSSLDELAEYLGVEIKYDDSKFKPYTLVGDIYREKNEYMLSDMQKDFYIGKSYARRIVDQLAIKGTKIGHSVFYTKTEYNMVKYRIEYMDSLYYASDVAKIVGIKNSSTVYKHMHSGLIEPTMINDGYRFTKDQVNRYIRKLKRVHKNYEKYEKIKELD